jgi:hypothetical protein
VRALVLVVLAVLIGGAFLAIGFDDGGDPESGIELGIQSDDDESGTTVPGAGQVPGAPDPESVIVWVGNGTGVAERGGSLVEQLRTAGYTQTLDPGEAPESPTTQVYFLPQQQPAATAVAAALGLSPAQVVAWPEPAPFEGAPFGSQVVVQAGGDLAGG